MDIVGYCTFTPIGVVSDQDHLAEVESELVGFVAYGRTKRRQGCPLRMFRAQTTLSMSVSTGHQEAV